MSAEVQLLPSAVTSYAFSRLKPSRFFDASARAVEWSVLQEQFGKISDGFHYANSSRLFRPNTTGKLKTGMPRLVFIVGPTGSGTSGNSVRARRVCMALVLRRVSIRYF